MKRSLLLLFSFTPLLLFSQTVLTLEQCLDSARRYNRSLRNAALSIEAATEQTREARTKYFPQVSANALAFQAFDKMLKGNGTIPAEVAALSPALAAYAGQPYAISEFNRAYNVSVSVMQPIYAGGQIHAANSLAQLQLEANRLREQLTDNELEQKITENFWQIATIKYNLATLDAADKQVAEMHRQVEQFLKAGIVTRNELLKVQLREQELAAARLRLDNAKHILLLLLAQQIGLYNQEIDIETSDAEPAAPHVGSASLNLALADKAVEAARLNVKMERAKLMPTVAAGLVGYNAGIGGLSSAMSHVVKTNTLNALAVVSVSVPISDWWGGGKAVKRRKIELQQSLNDRADAQERLAIDVQAALDNVNLARRQVEIARTSVEQAAENLRISSEQYRAGTETLTNLLDAETLNRQAQQSLNEALAALHRDLAIYRLKAGAER